MKFKGTYDILFCKDELEDHYFIVHIKADHQVIEEIKTLPYQKRFQLLSNRCQTNSKFVLVEGIIEIDEYCTNCLISNITTDIYENELRKILFGD